LKGSSRVHEFTGSRVISLGVYELSFRVGEVESYELRVMGYELQELGIRWSYYGLDRSWGSERGVGRYWECRNWHLK
jgi:hypothetical protein